MDFDLMIESIPKILSGAHLTVLLVTISLSMGFVFAIIAALLRRSKISVLVAVMKISNPLKHFSIKGKAIST